MTEWGARGKQIGEREGKRAESGRERERREKERRKSVFFRAGKQSGEREGNRTEGNRTEKRESFLARRNRKRAEGNRRAGRASLVALPPPALLFVPRTGIEPALPCDNQILSLARLPIPPSGLIKLKAFLKFAKTRFRD